MHLFLYNIFLLLYRLVIKLAALWNPKARRWIDGRVDIFEKLQSAIAQKPGPIIWMHCSSLGEFEQGRPLLENLKLQYPRHRFLITFFSPSGYEIRKDYNQADFVFYLPMDSKAGAKKFTEMVNPQLVLWVKYEYWFYYLSELKKKNIPLLLISGIIRKDQPFFKWYGRLHRYMLDSFTHFFVQTELSKQLLGQLGIKDNVSIAGDTRFDRVIDIAEKASPVEYIPAFCGVDPVIVAGSTWLEDEEELDHFANTHPHIKFIIAPHEIDEDRLKEVENLFRNTIRYSKIKEEGYKTLEHTTANVLIIDNIGMLSRLYQYASIAYIGGGFGDDGVHNVLEAAVYGKPVVFGPAYDKYIEAIDLVEKEAAYPIDNAVDLEKLINELLEDKAWLQKAGAAAKEYVYSNQGATKKIISLIQEKRLLTN